MKTYIYTLVATLAARAYACVYVEHEKLTSDGAFVTASARFWLSTDGPENAMFNFEENGVQQWRGSPDNIVDWSFPSKGKDYTPTDIIYPNGTSTYARRPKTPISCLLPE